MGITLILIYVTSQFPTVLWRGYDAFLKRLNIVIIYKTIFLNNLSSTLLCTFVKSPFLCMRLCYKISVRMFYLMYLHPQSCVFTVGPDTSAEFQQQQLFAVVTQSPSTTSTASAAAGAASTGTTTTITTTKPTTTTTTAATTAHTPVAASSVSTPSSLTGFLAPGGQLPTHKDTIGSVVATGKPSIVKVTLSPPSQQGQPQVQQQQRAAADEHLLQQTYDSINSNKYPITKIGALNDNHRQAYQLTNRSTDVFQSTPFKTSSASDWYYANYNKTNVEPFVGKNLVSANAAIGRSSATYTAEIPAAVMMAVTLLQVAILGFK